MKKVKRIKVDANKCTGCRACEVICSAFHASPRYSTSNPARARIHVASANKINGNYLPIFASEYTPAQCAGRRIYSIDGKEYDECTFCGASCEWRDIFKEPDSGLPLKCDMCEGDPTLAEPMCVQWCTGNCLTYEEREEEGEETEQPDEVERGLDALVRKYGAKTVKEAVSRVQED